MVLDAETIDSSSPFIPQLIGVVSILFFGSGGMVSLRKLANSKPGLIIDQRGIYSRDAGFPQEFIPWREIAGFDTWEIHRQRMVTIRFADPEAFIKQQSALKQKWFKTNQALCGSPLALNAGILPCSHEELIEMLNKALAYYKPSVNSHA